MDICKSGGGWTGEVVVGGVRRGKGFSLGSLGASIVV